MPDYTKQSDFDIAFESLMARRKKEIAEATNAWIRAVTGLKRLEDDEARDNDVCLAAMEILVEKYGFQVCRPAYLRPNHNKDGDDSPCYAFMDETGCPECGLRDKYRAFLEKEAKKKIPPPSFDLKLENDIWPSDDEIRWFYADGGVARTAYTPVGGIRPLCFASKADAEAFARFVGRYPGLMTKHRIGLDGAVLVNAPTKNMVTVRYLARVVFDPAETKGAET